MCAPGGRGGAQEARVARILALLARVDHFVIEAPDEVHQLLGVEIARGHGADAGGLGGAGGVEAGGEGDDPRTGAARAEAVDQLAARGILVEGPVEEDDRGADRLGAFEGGFGGAGDDDGVALGLEKGLHAARDAAIAGDEQHWSLVLGRGHGRRLTQRVRVSVTATAMATATATATGTVMATVMATARER